MNCPSGSKNSAGSAPGRRSVRNLEAGSGRFGKPHVHSGLAIRQLGKNLYECRTGLTGRLVFEAQKGVLTFDFAGDHDGVQNYLRSKR